MKWKNWLGWIGMVCIICQPVIVTAEEMNQAEGLYMEEIVVTASKAPKTAGNVTQKVRIIDREEMEDRVSGNRNVAELLQGEPGVFISVLSRNDANWGSSGGLSQKYNTYMVDGLPVDAFVEPQSLSPDTFDRIELQRGPASVLYPNYLSMDFSGNQSPLTGTTNILLKERIDRQMTRAELFYGSYNTFGGRAFHQQAADNLHFFFGGEYEQSDYTDYGTADSWLNMLDDPEYDKTKFYGKTTLFLNDDQDHKLSLFFNRTGHQGDTGRPNREFDHTYWTVNSSYALPVTPNLKAALKIGYRDYDRTWEDDNYPTDLSLASEEHVEQQILPADLSFSLDHMENALLTIGNDIQLASYETFSQTASTTPGNDAEALQYGIYVQEELAVQDLILRLGGRYSYTRHDIDLLGGSEPGNDRDSWNELLWSTGARYHATETVSVYANAGSSFVAPSLKSVGGTLNLSDQGVAGMDGQLPNPDLKPETGIGYDLGIDLKPARNLTLGARGFYTLVDDQIVTVVVSEDPSQSQDINAGDTTSYGIEVFLSHDPLDWFGWYANYTYTHTNISNDTDADQDDVEVPFVPMHLGNAGVYFRLPMDIRLAVSLSITSDIFDSNSRSGRTEFDGYELINAHVSKALALDGTYRAELFADIYNLTDNRYEMPWQFQDPGISAIAGIRLTF